MHTHHAQAPPSAKVPRIGGEYIQVEFEIVDVPFPMVANVSSHVFLITYLTPRICRMTKCCEQNYISESWKKKLELYVPVLLTRGIIPIIRSHKWPSYHKKSHGSGYEFSQQPSKGCGWSRPTINSEGAWDIYDKPKKNIFDHLVSQSYSSHLNFQNNRESQEKKAPDVVIIADWLLNGQAPFNPHQLVAIPKLLASHAIPGPHLLQRRVSRWPTWESSKGGATCSRFVLDLLVLFESFAKHQWNSIGGGKSKAICLVKAPFEATITSLFLSTNASNIKMTVLQVCICWRLTQIRFGENKKHPTGYPQKWRCPSGSDFP